MANERGRQRERMSAWEGISEGGKGRWRGRRRLKCSKNVLFNVHRFQFEHHRHGCCKLNCWGFFFFCLSFYCRYIKHFFPGSVFIRCDIKKIDWRLFRRMFPAVRRLRGSKCGNLSSSWNTFNQGEIGIFFFFFFASQPSGDVNSPQASWPVGRVIVRLWCLNVCQWCKPTEPDEAAEKNQKKKHSLLKAPWAQIVDFPHGRDGKNTTVITQQQI